MPVEVDDKPAPATTLAQPPRSRVASIVVGAAMLLALIVVMVRGPRRAHRATPPVVPDVPAASGSPADQLEKAMAELEAAPSPGEGHGIKNILAALEGVGRSTVGFKLPDGRDAPPLPSDAPRTVRLGVVLIKYRGAQLASDSAAPREVAFLRAQSLLKLAHDDFGAAVKAGDAGSNADVGTVARGVLEPGTEYTLFTLPAGWTSEVLDTPRGFWIARRLK